MTDRSDQAAEVDVPVVSQGQNDLVTGHWIARPTALSLLIVGGVRPCPTHQPATSAGEAA